MHQSLQHVNLKQRLSFVDTWLFVMHKIWQVCAAYHPESGARKGAGKYHQLRNSDIAHLNKAASRTFIPVEGCLSTKGMSWADPNTIQWCNTTAVNLISINSISSSLLMHLVDTISSITLSIMAKCQQYYQYHWIFWAYKPHNNM